MVHKGRAAKVIAARQNVLSGAYAAHPERFVNERPSPFALPEAVWINPPPSQLSSSVAQEKGLPQMFDLQKPDAPSAHPRSGYPSSGCVPAEPDSVSPDAGIVAEFALHQQPPSDTRAMPEKIPGVWGLAPKFKENCSRSDPKIH